MYAVKAEVTDPRAKPFTFREQQMMYGGKKIAKEFRGHNTKPGFDSVLCPRNPVWPAQVLRSRGV